MDLNSLISKIVDAGVALYLDEGQLRYRVAEGGMPPELLTEIREHKSALIQYIETLESGSEQDGFKIPDIDKRTGSANLPLSFTQKRLWFIDQLEGGSPLYNISSSFTLKGKINKTALRTAFEAIINRHEVLRTVISKTNDETVQVVLDDYELPIIELDYTHLSEAEQQDAVDKHIRADYEKVFDLSSNHLLFQIQFIRLAEEHHVMLFNMHHIITDGWSLNILMQELAALYSAECENNPGPLPPLEIQYGDYALWQQNWMQGEALDNQLSFWKDYLDGIPAVHQLPLDKPRPLRQSFEGKWHKQIIGKELTSEVRELIKTSETTLFMFLYTAFSVLIGRYSREEDIVIGTPVSGRNHTKIEGLIGCFVNSLVLRADLSGDPTFKKLLSENKQKLIETFNHQHVPFEMLVEAMEPERNMAVNPLFQIGFGVDNFDRIDYQFPGLELETILQDDLRVYFDLGLNVAEENGTLVFTWTYASDLFNDSTIHKIAESLEQLLASIVTNPAQKINKLNLLPEAEKLQLTAAFNNTAISFPTKKTIVELFEQQAAETPDRVAVVFEDRELTYGELNESANRLARGLMEQFRIQPDEIIGIEVDRSEWMITGMLGILKTGAAYLPIDPGHPSERSHYILEDSGVRLLLTEEKYYAKSEKNAPCPVIDIRQIEHADASNPEPLANAENLAYVIYTSGSTGKPKGVMVEHRNVVNFFTGMDQKIPLNDADNSLLAVTTISFDISALELFWTLTRGFKVVIRPTQKYIAPASKEQVAASSKKMDFSLFYFASEVDVNNKYKLLIEGAKFGDQNGFSAIWTPERHFHEFGGIYPNPAVAGAAIATITENIHIRSGSCVLPLHNPIRVAEEWSVVDNLSNGRVGMSFASGWVMNDFLAFAPENFESRHQVMYDGIEQVRSLWKGNSFTLNNPVGEDAEVKIYPQPLQKELPIWVTAAGNPETFRSAGALGANLLTHLLGQSIEELEGKIEIYRKAWKEAGHKGEGHVTLMIHTFIDEEMTNIREQVREPFRNYLRNATGLVRTLARSIGQDLDSESFTEADMESLLDHAFNRYFDTAALFGTPETCLNMVNRLSHIGVDELGCLVDFGLDNQTTIDGFMHLNTLKNQYASQVVSDESDVSTTDLIHAHQITHLQCTPSALKMMLLEPGAPEKMASLQQLMVGGEAFPQRLAEEALEKLDASIHNMYGPTETTIWSAVESIKEGNKITIGVPIANTQIYILDEGHNLLPAGVTGEICIGGDGVTRGYLNRSELTAEKFVTNSFTGTGRLYRTGDLGRWLPDGRIEFLGRTDYQVKIRGYRIELEEIEHCLVKHKDVLEAVVVAIEGSDEKELLACITSGKDEVNISTLRGFLQKQLPGYMIPGRFVTLDEMPLTPNGKIDKKALLQLKGAAIGSGVEYVAPTTELEKQLAAIWSEILERDEIGIRDNFFMIGGHSLKATRLVTRINKDMGLEVSLRAVFEQPTIEQLAQILETSVRTGFFAIERVEEQDHYAVSHAQRRLWVLDQLEEDSLAYNMPTAHRAKGRLSVEALNKALATIGQRHEALRTAFTTVDGMPVQVIDNNIKHELAYHDISDKDNKEELASLMIREDAETPFDLTKAPLFRLSLLKLDEEEHILLFNMHHIISDGWSEALFVKELWFFYKGFAAGEQPTLPELPIQYKDYTHWQNQLLESKDANELRNYWLDNLAGELPVLQLPYDKPRPKMQTYNGARLIHTLDKTLYTKLRELSIEQGASLFMTLTAAIDVLLYRYSGQKDLIIGTPMAGRQHADLEGVLGFFVNTLAIRCEVEPTAGFTNFLQQVKDVMTGAFEHQLYPFNRLVDELEPTRDLSRSPIFDIMVEMQNNEQIDFSFEEGELTPIIAETTPAKFDINVIFIEVEDGIQLVLEYNTDLFEASSMQRLADHFERLCVSITNAPGTAVAQLEMLPPNEKELLLETFNSNKTNFPEQQTIIQLFEEQVANHPDKPALTFDDTTLTYSELNEQANRLAHHLGLAYGEVALAGLCMDRGIDLCVAILAVWKTGGAYIPIDPQYPDSRIEGILEDSGADLLIVTDNTQPEQLNAFNGQTCLLSHVQDELKKASGENPPAKATPEDLAYVIFTSGSTGKPKGAMVEHVGMVNHLYSKINELGVTQNSVIAQNASHCFDISVWQYFTALLTGGRTVVYSNELNLQPEAFVEQVAADDITILEVVPSYLSVILSNLEEGQANGQKELDGLSQLVVTGEAVKPNLVNRWFDAYPAIPVVNAYGPTEASDDITHHTMTEKVRSEIVPIGKPVQNMNIYIVGSDMELCPLGVKGEIVVAGVGVGRGYLNDEDRTKLAFTTDPYAQNGDVRLYKTGDIGRWLPDGTIEFWGRADAQVKIRGFRIELGEIEHQISALDGVVENVVLARENHAGQKVLVAYIVCEDGMVDTVTSTLETKLAVHLPEYMIPSQVTVLDTMPLTRNGKLDKKALLAYDVTVSGGQEYVAPRNETEEQLAAFYGELLNLEQVGIHDNFFELGGHSLLATRLISIIRKRLNTEVSLRTLFEFPTIAGLAGSLDSLTDELLLPEIPILEDRTNIPLSYAQQRLWFIDQLEEGSPQYNIPGAFKLSGQLDKEAFKQTITTIIDRHEVLRTTFATIDEQPVQRIVTEYDLPFKELDLSDLDKNTQEKEVKRLAKEEALQAFDLKNDLPFRLQLLILSEEEHVVFFTMHHIASDGWSQGIVVQEFTTLYTALAAGKAHNLDPLNVQYADYTSWQRDWLQGDVLQQQQSFWKDQLAGIPEVHNLPLDKTRPSHQSYNAGRYRHEFNEDLTARINALCQDYDVTLFMFLQTAFSLLLGRYSNESDIVIGTNSSNRVHQDVEGLIGFFINTLVLRTNLEGNPKFEELMADNKQMILDAYTHQAVPYEMLVEELKPDRNLAYNPICQIILVLENYEDNQFELPGITLSLLDGDVVRSRYDLVLSINETRQGLTLNWNYKTDLFAGATIERMATSFEQILERVVVDPKLQINELELVNPEEKELLDNWQGAIDNSGRDLILPLAFEQQVALTPNNTAVRFMGLELSYAELNGKANQLAYHLKEKELTTGSVVGIYMERSLELMSALLGVMKSGAAYVPLDPRQDGERLQHMVADAGIQLVLTQSHLSAKLTDVDAPVLALDEDIVDAVILGMYDTENPSASGHQYSAEDAAYIIFTSGSTGLPKGVEIRHSGLIDYCAFALKHYYKTNLAGSLVGTAHSFDITIPSLYLPLLAGGCVELPLWDEELPTLAKKLTSSSSYLLRLTPMHLRGILDLMDAEVIASQEHVFVVGGDRFPTDLIGVMRQRFPNAAIYNHYGPTETVIGCSIYNISSDYDAGKYNREVVPIGRPMDNTSLYVFNEALVEAPIGVTGELHIGGPCVGKGYINQEDLTNQKFIPNPFDPGQRLYKTGDMVRWLPDGNLEFVGRVDEQVKIRGYRIEPGEIESHLSKIEVVKDCAVLARPDQNGNKVLVGYVVTDDRSLDTQAVKTMLGSSLPDYMIPAHIVIMESMPLTRIGKVDKKALLALELDFTSNREYVAPSNETETQLAAIWQEVLDLDQVGIRDNFFEIGGHSLIATRMVSRIRRDMGLQASLKAVFEYPTIEELASVLAQGDQAEFISIERVEEKEHYPVSHAQRRLWVLDQFEGANTIYNLPTAFTLSGELDIEALSKALNALGQRHESLRTYFITVEGNPMQVIDPNCQLNFKFHDLSDQEDKNDRMLQMAEADATTPFDLSQAPLIRVQLIKLADDEHAVLFNMHHIISDGWSMEVLVRELLHFYRGYVNDEVAILPDLSIQYKDFSHWQNSLLESEKANELRDYWLDQLRGELPILQLPYDRSRPAVKTHEGASVKHPLDAALTTKLQELSNEQGNSLFMTLTAIVNILLYRHSGQTDIIIGSPIAGRQHTDLEGLIGFFVNTLALRSKIDPEASFDAFLQQTQETITGAMEHQLYPFDSLVDELNIARDMSRHPLFDVMVVMHNNESAAIEFENIKLTPITTEAAISRFDLHFVFAEDENGLQFSIDYNTSLFEQETIERLSNHFEELCKSIVSTPQAAIRNLEILAKAEKELLLETFNDTSADYPNDIPVIEQFEAQVTKSPDHIAVTFEGRELTFEQLNAKANRMAHFLMETGFGPHDKIGIFMERSPELMVSLLSILKTGAAYVPFDPNLRGQRLEYMIADAGIEMVLVQSQLVESLPLSSIDIMVLDKTMEEDNWLEEYEDHNLEQNTTPDHTAYVIYTSGSSGKPKGVEIPHSGLSDYIAFSARYYYAEQLDGSLVASSHSFDATIPSLYLPLIKGDAVKLVATEDVLQEMVTHLEAPDAGNYLLRLTPMHLQGILELMTSEQVLSQQHAFVIGGEAFTPELYRALSKKFPESTIYNHYGPTETVVGCSIYNITANYSPYSLGRGTIPIGKPMDNTRLYVLDNNLQPVPIGVAGELHVAGPCVGKGYINKPELTATHFIADPFSDDPNARMYKTGDQVCWLPDGNIDFFGRVDDQVKIRGYRIELGEIEHCLSGHEEVKEVVVLPIEGEHNEKELMACMVVDNMEINTAALRSFLAQQLPEYMIPARFVTLDEMPLTTNGKVDKKALKEFKGAELATGVEFVAPRTDIEKQLADIWSEVLDREQVGIKDDFFEIGGHSLKATRMVSRIHRDMKRDATLREVFEHATIEELAAALSKKSTTDYLAIEPVEEQEHYPVSNAQRRLWVLHQLEKEHIAYNMPAAFTLTGRVDVEALDKALTTIGQRHETLRTRFTTKDGEPVQIIDEDCQLRLEHHDIRKEQDKDDLVREMAQTDATTSFNLELAPLVRVQVITLEEDEHVVLFNMHHIISDGWSMEILVQELLTCYNSFERGEQPQLSNLSIQYKDYSHWQNELLASDQANFLRDYWRDQLSGEIPMLQLPGDYARPAIKTDRGARVEYTLNTDLSKQLVELSNRHCASLFMTLTAVLKVLLYRYSGQTDIVIGTPTAGRQHTDLEGLIGLFINTLALRSQVNPEEHFENFLGQIKETITGAMEHQVYPFDSLVDELDLQRDMSRHPIFDVLVVMENNEKAELELDGVSLTPFLSNEETSKFDLNFHFTETEKGLNISLRYSTDLFGAERMQNMLLHFEELCASIMSEPATPVQGLNILPEAERKRVTKTFNDNKKDFPDDKTISQLVEEQAARTPNHIAVIFEDNKLTYKELNERANGVAHYLRNNYSITPESVVGLMVERSEWMVVGLLGILKAGCAYVPIMMDQPYERVMGILGDCECEVMLIDESFAALDFDIQTVSRENIKTVAEPNPENPEIINGNSDPAYVLFTSGSTGKPKGAQLTHRGVTSYICAFLQDVIDLNENDIVLQFASLNWDPSVKEIWAPLMVGAAIVIDGEQNPVATAKLVHKNDITIILNFIPSLLLLLLDEFEDHPEYCEHLKLIWFGGEKLDLSVCERAREVIGEHIILHNLYGPTECTLSTAWFPVPENLEGLGEIPIGKPVPNAEVFILTGETLMPVGVPGEICIGGVGLANGYVNNPELTAEKFVPHPFKPGERLYRTGDLAYWRPDGNINIVGRVDDQVKVRGIRIELGEIEHHLNSHPGITRAHVLAVRTEYSELELMACIQADDAEINTADLRNYLQRHLPVYMIPGRFLVLDEMPLMPNGKVNKKALRQLEGTDMDTGREYLAPRSETEAQLAAIWAEVLGKEQISIKDNFFEIGGHSLKAIRMVSRIHRNMGREATLREVFEYPTIELLAKVISEKALTAFIAIEPVEEQEHYPVSHAQRRLWVLDHFDNESTAYNMPAAFTLSGDLDITSLDKALNALGQRHESLRTYFATVDGDPVQVIDQDCQLAFQHLDISQKENKEALLKEMAEQDANTPFDLDNAPLMRVQLVKLEEQEHAVLFNMHHIISDGWSMEVLVRELLHFYRSFTTNEAPALPDLPIQYKDYSHWQNNLLENDDANNIREYWHNQLSGELPVLNLPYDQQRPVVKTHRGATIQHPIDTSLTEKLQQLSNENGASLFMTLTAIVNVLLYRYSGQTDIIIGSPVAGRQHSDLEGLIGFFVNTLPLRSEIKPESGFDAFLREVKETVSGAMEHQLYPFDRLVDELNIPRDMSRHPIFDVMVVMQNNESAAIEFENITLSPLGTEDTVSKFDLNFVFTETDEGLRVSLQYNTDLFEAQSIERLLMHFEKLCSGIIDSPCITLRQINLLEPAEEQLLLETFNATEKDYPQDKTLINLFEQQVDETPDNVAVAFEGNELTFRELNEKANTIAHHIIADYDPSPDDIIAIMLERSEWMITSLLGIMKAGAAYLPIDPDYPTERLQFILQDSGAKLLLTEEKHLEKTQEIQSVKVIDIRRIENADVTNPDKQAEANHLAYVIYTSGSTGKPKGVMIEHHAIVNRLLWMKDQFELTADEVILQKTPFTFDVSVWELFLPGIIGAKLCMLPPGDEKIPSSLARSMTENQVTVMHFVPSMLSVFNEYCAVDDSITDFSDLKIVFTSGEALSTQQASDFFQNIGNKNNTRLVNKYGPTEAAVDVSYFECSDSESYSCIPIGKPIANVSLHILDSANQLQLVGVPGELCIAGANLARGYLNRSELTAEKFVEHPFEEGERIYKTGDLARWLPDGNIEFLGRLDDQVKIRGFRIELGEIAHSLLGHEAIQEAIVLDSPEKELIAYVTSNDSEINTTELRTFLRQQLPDYMIPSRFVLLGEIPLTANGKVNKKALRNMKGTELQTNVAYVAPRNEIEERLTTLFSEVLRVEQVGVLDNFFELGGHSLLAIKLINRVNEEFELKINIRDVFEKTVVEDLAAHIAQTIELMNTKGKLFEMASDLKEFEI